MGFVEKKPWLVTNSGKMVGLKVNEGSMEMQALVEEIAELVEKIKNGTATLGELEAFAAATNMLNERAIVLRHKAYEAKVYGVSTPFDSAQGEPLDDHQSVEEIEPSFEVTNEQEELIEEVQEPITQTEPEEEISFDLFSMDDSDFDSVQSPALDELPGNLESQEEEPEPEKEAEEVIPFDEPTPVNDTVTEGQTVDSSISFDEEDEDELVQPLGEEAAIFETKPEISSVSTTPSQPVLTGEEHPVVRKALTNDGTLQARLLTVRLETLKSAFGLNERLQIVKELFKGSNEAYSTALEQLDSQSDKSAARALVNSLAHTYSWNVDSELALEFVQKVERRYA